VIRDGGFVNVDDPAKGKPAFGVIQHHCNDSRLGLDCRDSSDESNEVIHNLYIFFWQLGGAMCYSPLHNIMTPKKAPPSR
jgi:hypothetical protein